MSDTIAKSDGARPGPEAPLPDAQGQAAMLLVESLIHGLIARSVITVAEAIEIVDNAVDAQEEIDFDLGYAPAQTTPIVVLLRSISVSLASDINKGPTEPRN